MSQESIKFWSSHENVEPLTIEAISEVVTPQEAFSFANGLHEIYQTAKAISPDVVFLPERGAAPFGWALDYFGRKEGAPFLQIPMIIGTGTDVFTGQIGGQRKPEKQKNVERAVQIATDITGGIQNPLLIDEVQFGGTISQASHYLHVFLEAAGANVPLNLIAVEDSKKGGWKNKKAKGYARLVSNRRPHIKSSVISMHLFTIDWNDSLNRLLVEPHAQDSEPLPIVMHDKLVERPNASRPQPMPMILQNTDSRIAIEMLLGLYSGAEMQISNEWFSEYQRICQLAKAA